MIPEKLSQLIETIKLKYDIKREYFTVGIPVIIALLLVVLAIMNGHTLFVDQSTSAASSQMDERQKALEEQMKQFEEDSGDSSTDSTTAADTTPPLPSTVPDLDQYLVFASIIALTPYSIDRFRQRSNKKRQEEDFSQFLFKMSEMMRSGIDPIKSVIELSKTDLGSITPNVQLAASTMILGGSFEEGMRKTAVSLKSDLVSKYIQLVVQASYMGGQVSNLILKASEDLRSMIKIEREMEGNLKQYVMIFYFAQIILIVMVYILATQMFPFLTAPGMTQMFGGAGMGDINYNQLFFHMLILNGLIGGVIVGKISEGSAQDGLKHSVILTIISYLACTFLLFPAASSGVGAINMVSGDAQTGMVGMPLENPLVFQALDTKGSPKVGTYLEINITPSGKLSDGPYITDDGGNVTVKVLLGDSSGPYQITAKMGTATKTAIATADSV